VFHVDLVAALFGMRFGETSALSAVVYGLVGIAGLYPGSELEVDPAALARCSRKAPGRNAGADPVTRERKEERKK